MKENESPYEPPSSAPDDEFSRRPATELLRFVPKRLLVILPAVICMVAGAAALTLLVSMKTMIVSWALFEFFTTILTGPLGAQGPPGRGTIATGLATLGLATAHPIWPNVGTAILTCLAVAFWFLCGLAIACISV